MRELQPEGPEVSPSPVWLGFQACPVQLSGCSQQDGAPVAWLAGAGASINDPGEPTQPHPSLARLLAGAV